MASLSPRYHNEDPCHPYKRKKPTGVLIKIKEPIYCVKHHYYQEDQIPVKESSLDLKKESQQPSKRKKNKKSRDLQNKDRTESPLISSNKRPSEYVVKKEEPSTDDLKEEEKPPSDVKKESSPSSLKEEPPDLEGDQKSRDSIKEDRPPEGDKQKEESLVVENEDVNVKEISVTDVQEEGQEPQDDLEKQQSLSDVQTGDQSPPESLKENEPSLSEIEIEGPESPRESIKENEPSLHELQKEGQKSPTESLKETEPSLSELQEEGPESPRESLKDEPSLSELQEESLKETEPSLSELQEESPESPSEKTSLSNIEEEGEMEEQEESASLTEEQELPPNIQEMQTWPSYPQGVCSAQKGIQTEECSALQKEGEKKDKILCSSELKETKSCMSYIQEGAYTAKKGQKLDQEQEVSCSAQKYKHKVHPPLREKQKIDRKLSSDNKSSLSYIQDGAYDAKKEGPDSLNEGHKLVIKYSPLHIKMKTCLSNVEDGGCRAQKRVCNAQRRLCTAQRRAPKGDVNKTRSMQEGGCNALRAQSERCNSYKGGEKKPSPDNSKLKACPTQGGYNTLEGGRNAQKGGQNHIINSCYDDICPYL